MLRLQCDYFYCMKKKRKFSCDSEINLKHPVLSGFLCTFSERYIRQMLYYLYIRKLNLYIYINIVGY